MSPYRRFSTGTDYVPFRAQASIVVKYLNVYTSKLRIRHIAIRDVSAVVDSGSSEYIAIGFGQFIADDYGSVI